MAITARFLVTAGNTQERIDAVRVWSNIFTGNTGLSIARALAAIGGDVDLLTSNRQHLAEIGQDWRHDSGGRIRAEGFTDHASLRDALAERMRQQRYDGVFMSAAVSDYRPAGVFAVISRQTRRDGQQVWVVQDVQAPKVKSSHHQIAVLGEPTEKLVDLFRREWNYKGLLVKFKLEVGIDRQELIRIGQASRIASGADYLVANTLSMVHGAEAGALLLSDSGAEWVSRSMLASRLAQITKARLSQTSHSV
ncbi:phosphopantothenoylcysteine decarboxylase [Fontivita pretiosa]|uniref:phosphopantothenoylcysteine decarboxylase domain-containing protein n=1 Tax=Fontivita pretiosa TaxID=2989684 RepID=UPI003D181668